MQKKFDARHSMLRDIMSKRFDARIPDNTFDLFLSIRYDRMFNPMTMECNMMHFCLRNFEIFFYSDYK